MQERYVSAPGFAGLIDEGLQFLARSSKPFCRPVDGPESHRTVALIGSTETGKPITLDLRTAPHLLVAGTTGSGKSVCLNAIICSLLCKDAPSDLKLYMIDPKRVELARYRRLPHLGAPIATDRESAEMLLRRVHAEMMERFDIMEEHDALSWDELNHKHILVVFDEYASLMDKEGKKRLVPLIQDIARLGRAAGVHLVLATQRPTRDIIDGQTKANCPTRIAFRVPTVTDSRVILDATGAEILKGKGDGIFLAGNGDKKRFQGVYCSNEQVQYLVDYWVAEMKTEKYREV